MTRCPGLTKNVLYLLSYVGIRSIIPVLVADVYRTGSIPVEGVGFEPTQPFQAADLQSAPINHSGTPPDALWEPSPRGESNPLTYRLQVGCATIALLGQHF